MYTPVLANQLEVYLFIDDTVYTRSVKKFLA